METLLRNLINIKRLAYKTIKEDSLDFFIEKCYRYYSKTYHTPLKEAYKLPKEEITLIFFQDEMLEGDADDMELIRDQLESKLEPVLQMPEVLKQTKAILSEEEWVAKMNLEVKNEMKAKEAKKPEMSQEDIIKQTHDAIAALTTSLGKIKEDN
jgi:hypothetical protein